MAVFYVINLKFNELQGWYLGINCVGLKWWLSFHVLDSIWFLSEFDSNTCILNNENVMITLSETTIFIKD